MRFSIRPSTPRPTTPVHAELNVCIEPADVAALDTQPPDLTRFAAAFIVTTELRAQAARRPNMRDLDLVDALLDVRNALMPPDPLPADPVVPVIPGRS